MLLTFQMLSLHKLVMIRNIGWNSVPDSVAAKPNIQKIDDLKNSGIIKIFVSVILWDTVSIIIGLAHITQDPFRGTLRPSSLQSFGRRHYISPFDRHSPHTCPEA